MEVGLGRAHIVLDGESAPRNEKGHSSPPLSKFTDVGFKLRPMSIVAKRLDGLGCHLVRS